MIEIVEILKAIIFGIIQGITEWLPISSTGHLILADEFINLNCSADFLDLFEVVIQLGSIIAVIVLFFHKLNPFSPKKNADEKKSTWSLWFKVAVATIPVVFAGLLLDDYMDSFKTPYVIAAALIIYGVLFIFIEKFNRKAGIDGVNKLTYKMAFLVGCVQMLSLIPGTSRSGSTILGAVLLGCTRTFASEFSFFMAVPAMLGASALKLLRFGFSFELNEIIILAVGTVVSFIVSVFAIKFLLNYIKKHDFKAFGIYRIILGIAVIIYFGFMV